MMDFHLQFMHHAVVKCCDIWEVHTVFIKLVQLNNHVEFCNKVLLQKSVFNMGTKP